MKSFRSGDRTAHESGRGGKGWPCGARFRLRIHPRWGSIGADELARWHAKGGRYTVSLIASHALLISWGYSVTGHTNVISQTGTLVMSYPDVLMATVGGLLFLGVGAVSARAARR